MPIQNPISMEEFKKTIGYGLYFPFPDEQEQRRSEVLADYEKRLSQIRLQLDKTPELEQSLILGFSDWRLFTGIVSSLKHITQQSGEDDSCILAYHENTRHLYLAREMFFGLPSPELASEYIFSGLAKGFLPAQEIKRLFPDNYTPEARRRNKTTVDEHLQLFLNNRIIPYTLTDLVELLFDRITIEKLSEFADYKMDPNYDAVDQANIQRELDIIKTTKPRNIREFVRYVESFKGRKASQSIDDIADKLGEIGIWNAKAHQLFRKVRIDLVEGNINEIANLNLDLGVITRYLLADGKYQDAWIPIEMNEFQKDYSEFLTQTREYISQSIETYSQAIQQGKRKHAKTIKKALIRMKESVTTGVDENINQLIQEMKDAIRRMTS